MLLLTFVALQAADPATSGNNWLKQSERCPRQSGEEIVVCGRPGGQSPYRIGPQPTTPPALPEAAFKLPNSSEVKLSAEQGEVGGIPTNRAMIRLKIKF